MYNSCASCGQSLYTINKFVMTWRGNHNSIGGKISIFTALIGVAILALGVLGELPHGKVAYANNATTSVTVLNTAPQWDTNIYVQETVASATSSPSLPTNSGVVVNWYASATDSSNDPYYLLLCNKIKRMPKDS